MEHFEYTEDGRKFADCKQCNLLANPAWLSDGICRKCQEYIKRREANAQLKSNKE